MNKIAWKSISATMAVVLMVAMFVSVFLFASNNEPAAADTTAPTCSIQPLGESPNLTVSCVDAEGNQISPSDINVNDIINGTVTVVVDNVVEVPGPTVTIPGETVTLPVPGPTVTVPGATVTAPGATVTLPPIPGPTVSLPPIIREIIKIIQLPGETVTLPSETRTVTKSPEPRIIERVVNGPERVVRVVQPGRPGPTVTATVTATPEAGQPGPVPDRIEPAAPLDPPGIDFSDGINTPAEVGLSTLTLLGLMGLILLGLYGGYILGYKDKERAETNFMRALLDASKLRTNR